VFDFALDHSLMRDHPLSLSLPLSLSCRDDPSVAWQRFLFIFGSSQRWPPFSSKSHVPARTLIRSLSIQTSVLNHLESPKPTIPLSLSLDIGRHLTFIQVYPSRTAISEPSVSALSLSHSLSTASFQATCIKQA
jgi:hypothetical protein